MPIGDLPTGLGKRSTLLDPENDASYSNMYDRARVRAAEKAKQREETLAKQREEALALQRAAAEEKAQRLALALAKKQAKLLEAQQRALLRAAASTESEDSLSVKEEEEEEEEEEEPFTPRDPSPPMGVDEPSWNGVVYNPESTGLPSEEVQRLRDHFEVLKGTYHSFQGVTRGMSAVSREAGGVFPEMWKPFDSSKTWPMCIFYRNPELPQMVYEACRSNNCAIYGDNTSPRMSDPVWDERMEKGLVARVKDYVSTRSEEFGLQRQVAFSIQVLWYDTKTRKAEHKDPKAYTIISALNLQGRADLELYDRKKRRTHQCVHLPEGSLYVMHNDAVRTFEHAVSAPDASFKDSRVTMILRFCDERDLNILKREAQRLLKLSPEAMMKKRKHQDCVVAKDQDSVEAKEDSVEAKN